MDRRGVSAVDLAAHESFGRTNGDFFAIVAAGNQPRGQQCQPNEPHDLGLAFYKVGNHGQRRVGWIGDAGVTEAFSLIQSLGGVLAIYRQADGSVPLLPRQRQEGIQQRAPNALAARCDCDADTDHWNVRRYEAPARVLGWEKAVPGCPEALPILDNGDRLPRRLPVPSRRDIDARAASRRRLPALTHRIPASAAIASQAMSHRNGSSSGWIGRIVTMGTPSPAWFT